MQEALCQCIFLLLFAGRDRSRAAVVVGDATRAGDSWCTVPEVGHTPYTGLMACIHVCADHYLPSARMCPASQECLKIG